MRYHIVGLIVGSGSGVATDFQKVAQADTSLIDAHAPGAHSLEGYLFPETYEFSRMQSMEDMPAAMVKQFRQVARQIGLIQSSGSSAAGSDSPTFPPPDPRPPPPPIPLAHIHPTPPL